MRVLQINKFFWLKGGAERYFFMVSEELERRGHDVSHFAMAHPRNEPSPYAGHFVSRRDYGEASGVFSTMRHGVSFVRSREAARNIRRLVRDFRPDVAHLHNIYHQLTPSIIDALSRSGVPVVTTLHDYKLLCPNYCHFAGGRYCYRCRGGKYYHAPLQRCSGGSLSRSLLLAVEAYWQRFSGVYGRVDRYIAPSRFMRDRVAESAHTVGIEPDRVVYLASYCPPVETAGPDLSYAEQRLVDGLPARSIVYFGRLSVEKGLDTLLTAAAALPGVPVVVCGDGPARTALEARAADESIGNVVFTGYVNKPVLDRILGKAAGVVLPAIWPENAPFTVIEAAAAGVPLIVSDMGGLPEMADIVDGLVVPNGDGRALAEAIGRLWDDPEAARERGERGRRAALGYFEKSAHMEALEQIYAEVTARS
jgi:glycosyltransferase involved in cell wall biosynthesis